MSGIGRSPPRREDPRLLAGRGRFTDDVNLERQAHGAVVRSPHAHASIRSVDTDAAANAPGVLGVFVADDLVADGVRPIPGLSRVPGLAFENRDGSAMADPAYFPLARGKVRHVGDAVAFVVAQTRDQALDAAELVEVDYQALPVVTDGPAALAPDAPQIWDEYPGNLCFDWEAGDRASVDAAFADAAHVTSLELVNNRIIVSFLEPRAAVAGYDETDRRLTLYAGSQSAHRHKAMLAGVLGLEPEQVRVVTGDVGGAFGARTFLYPEYVLVAWATRRLGRPVKWTATRSEDFVSDLGGRDHAMIGEMAFDPDGRITALRASSVCNIGAYVSSLAVFVAIVNTWRTMSGAYLIPHIWFGLKGAFTNTPPVNAYRGVGRAEVIYLIERLMDTAAGELGVDRTELRRRNFVGPEMMEYTTPTGAVYDSGEFAATMDAAIKESDWNGFPARKKAARERGRLRGIGMSYYIEGSGGLPLEYAKVVLDADGALTAFAGCQPSGQGLETTLVQVLADRFGVGADRISIVIGDTDAVDKGHGTFASRSMRMAGSAVVGAGEEVIEMGKAVAGHLLEASVSDVGYADGRYTVTGTDRPVTLAEVAAAAASDAVPKALRGPLSADLEYQSEGFTYPNGCHVCEVEIDPDTGVVSVVGHTVVDDVGRVINPAIVHGQTQGGVAQGIGQALFEHSVFEADSGQLLSGSFMDYTLPRADTLPFMATHTNEVICGNNPLGVKGAGEGGATGAPASVINAVVDALREYGVRHVDMPAIPERVWRLVHEAQRR